MFYAGDRFEGDAVLVTTPLGCLKDGQITFQPKLPPWKFEAIHKLGFGTLNKVRMRKGCQQHFALPTTALWLYVTADFRNVNGYLLSIGECPEAENVYWMGMGM